MSILQRLLARLKSGFGPVRDENKFGGVDYPKLSQAIGYTTKNRELFAQALSHRSYLQVVGNESALSNERLEFLGDAVLNLVVAEYLFNRDSSAPEGDLTKFRSRLVNARALSAYAREVKLSGFLLTSPSALQVGDKGLETILADAYEALLGAIYLDGGFEEARRFIEHNMLASLHRGLVRTEDENFKSQLLEYTQASGFGTPRYVTVNEEGPDHDRTFTVEVFLGGDSYGIGTGKNKKDAEQLAAEKALQKLRLIDSTAV